MLHNLQRISRGHAAHKKFTTIRKAAITIQRIFRGHRTHEQFKKTRQAVIDIQRTYRGHTGRAQFNKVRDAASNPVNIDPSCLPAKHPSRGLPPAYADVIKSQKTGFEQQISEQITNRQWGKLQNTLSLIGKIHLPEHLKSHLIRDKVFWNERLFPTNALALASELITVHHSQVSILDPILERFSESQLTHAENIEFAANFLRLPMAPGIRERFLKHLLFRHDRQINSETQNVWEANKFRGRDSAELACTRRSWEMNLSLLCNVPLTDTEREQIFSRLIETISPIIQTIDSALSDRRTDIDQSQRATYIRGRAQLVADLTCLLPLEVLNQVGDNSLAKKLQNIHFTSVNLSTFSAARANGYLETRQPVATSRPQSASQIDLTSDAKISRNIPDETMNGFPGDVGAALYGETPDKIIVPILADIFHAPNHIDQKTRILEGIHTYYPKFP
ncbi:hypothetical protein EBR57_09585, partial [bacterium]|nr:hypothetical protein [bacterium]